MAKIKSTVGALSRDEFEFITLYRKCDPQRQALIERALRALAEDARRFGNPLCRKLDKLDRTSPDYLQQVEKLLDAQDHRP